MRKPVIVPCGPLALLFIALDRRRIDKTVALGPFWCPPIVLVVTDIL